MKHETKTGTSHPLCATLSDGGTNFSLFSRSATRVELVFFDRADAASPTRSIELDPHLHRTYHYWHAFVPGVKAGSSMAIACMGPGARSAACGSIRPRYCWFLTVAGSWCRQIQPADRRATGPQLRQRHEERGDRSVRL